MPWKNGNTRPDRASIGFPRGRHRLLRASGVFFPVRILADGRRFGLVGAPDRVAARRQAPALRAILVGPALDAGRRSPGGAEDVCGSRRRREVRRPRGPRRPYLGRTSEVMRLREGTGSRLRQPFSGGTSSVSSGLRRRKPSRPGPGGQAVSSGPSRQSENPPEGKNTGVPPPS